MSRADGAVDPQLALAVQTNCHIADATHAGEMTLCVYLLQMREFCRWEQDLPPTHVLARQDVAAWLSDREALWDQLEGEPFRQLPVRGRMFDPWDALGINKVLEGTGLYYGAGYTAPGRATFFLAELESVERREEQSIFRLGREYARSLASPPATWSAHGIELRQESLQRWLWEKYEAWTLRRSGGAFKRALDYHGFEQLGERAVDEMAIAESDTLILHELAEARVSEQLGSRWQALRLDMQDRRTDLLLRAVRDLLADCQMSLPVLLQLERDASVHFWFSNFEGWRRVLFPGLQTAYEAWCDGQGLGAMRDAIGQGERHWTDLCQQALALHRRGGAAAREEIRQVLESAVLQAA